MAIFARLRAGIIFIFTRVSRECQWRQKQGDIVIFRALFVFTRPITHAQFANCRACALKNRKPKKWHPVFDYPRVRGISIPLTVNARGLWGRDWTYLGRSKGPGGAGRSWPLHDCPSKEICQSFENSNEHARSAKSRAKIARTFTGEKCSTHALRKKSRVRFPAMSLVQKRK